MQYCRIKATYHISNITIYSVEASRLTAKGVTVSTLASLITTSLIGLSPRAVGLSSMALTTLIPFSTWGQIIS